MPRLTDINRSSLLLFLTQSRRICLDGCHVKQRFGELTLLAGLAAVYRLAAQNNPQDLARPHVSGEETSIRRLHDAVVGE